MYRRTSQKPLGKAPLFSGAKSLLLRHALRGALRPLSGARERHKAWESAGVF